MLERLNWNFALPVGLLVGAVLIASWFLREKPTMQRGDEPPPAPLVEVITARRPFLGICLGLQLLFDVSYEGEACCGLGVLPGKVVRFELIPSGDSASRMSCVAMAPVTEWLCPSAIRRLPARRR